MKLTILIPIVCVAVASATAVRADIAYGDLNNFDTVNDTGGKCYGFLIELDDVRSTDITYTYDFNHYGPPRITEDTTDPLHPKVFVSYESKKNPDGSFASFTNAQDPANPIGPTGGHACTNPSVNLGCEHFGIGLYRTPTLARYNWLVEDSQHPGNLILGPAVHTSMPSFTYVPPPAPAVPAQIQVVIQPPEQEVEPPPDQFGVPVWVKVFKTVQPSGHHIELKELVTNDETRVDDSNWEGEEAPETEIEWMVFQKRPANNPGGDELEAADDLPNGDETVTRRYEFYTYLGPTNPEDGEAQCDNPDNCPDAVGPYIGAQMGALNPDSPLGLIDHLQDGEQFLPYVDRTVVVGGNTPYLVEVSAGALPDGMEIDPVTGILSGTPTVAGTFTFTIDAIDADVVAVSKEFSLRIVAPLAIATGALPDGKEDTDYSLTLEAEGGVGPYFWSADALPTGLSLSLEGVLSGKPEVGTAGDYLLTFTVGDTLGNTVSLPFSLTIAPNQPPAVRGDIDGDGDVDRADLNMILAARNTPASGPEDPRDLDHDGKITILDARIAVTLFSRPGGATQ